MVKVATGFKNPFLIYSILPGYLKTKDKKSKPGTSNKKQRSKVNYDGFLVF